MAKMFYSLEEAAERLRKTPEEVREMASRNEITEFRDGDKLIFKVEQVDLLTSDDDEVATEESMIPLVDSTEASAMGLAESATGSGTDLGGTGISVFDADDLEEADDAAATMMTEDPLDSVSLESFGSGSGLMDLTRESDDTSLGADGLLDDLYGSEDAEAPQEIGESGLFEGASTSAGLDEDEGLAAVVTAVETIDPKWSGAMGGLSLGIIAAAGAGLAMVLMGVMGAPPVQVVEKVGTNMLIPVGGLLGLAVVLGGVGFFLGSRK